MKEMKLDRQEFNLLVNDILLDVKPVKLRISIANRLVEFFDKKQERIAELKAKLEESEKENQELTSKYITWRNKSDEYKQEFHKSMNEAEDYKKMFYCLCGQQEQAKIEFVVDKIQELKKSLRDKVCLMENDEHCYPQNAIHWQDVVSIIDNQIQQLTH